MLQVKEYIIPGKGVVHILDDHAHVDILEAYHKRWFTRKIFNDTIGEQIKQYGHSYTSCKIDSPHIDFIERMGYRVSKVVGDILIFKMTRNKYARS